MIRRPTAAEEQAATRTQCFNAAQQVTLPDEKVTAVHPFVHRTGRVMWLAEMVRVEVPE